MHIVFRNLEDWYKKDPDLKGKFEDTYSKLLQAASQYANSLNDMSVKKAGTPIKVNISEMLLKQALIDAFDDLMRLKDYHLTTDPNRLKEMSYIVFWILRHKPITLETEEIVLNTKINDIGRARLLFINESFCIKLLIGATFPSAREKANCQACSAEGKRQLQYFKKFLLYYLVYRVDSPKSIEAILLGTTIFPVWEVDPVIWSISRNPEDGF